MTAQEVFDRAESLMDSGAGSTGAGDMRVRQIYKRRGLGILNLLGEECRDLGAEEDEEDEGEERDCDKCPWQDILDYNQPILLPRAVSAGVLPYGLAAHLLLEEDPAAANFYQQRYEERLNRFKRRQAKFQRLKAPYGGIELGQDGRWNLWQ